MCIRDRGYKWEVIFINDGSSDNSSSILIRLFNQNPNVKVLEFNRNYGQHAAVFAGFEAVEGEIVVILDADKYVKIISFLFYDSKLCDLLIKKRRSSNIDIEVFTTPAEAAESAEIKEAAIHIQKRLREAGIRVIICDWEVGQPELTISTRAGGRIPRWFAMHAKCLITNKYALITSADFIPTFSLGGDWNTCIIYTDRERISLLNQKYEKLKNFFNNVNLYIDPDYIDTSVSPRKLIRGYPLDKVQKLSILQDGFYFLPHEGYGREIIKSAIHDAEKYIYLIFETIYDDELTRFIIKKLISNPSIDFKIVTSPLTAYVQNPAKTRATFVQLASYGAKIRTMNKLRAKLLVTDKVLISGSFDLVKMGIGMLRNIGKGLKALVASTEIMDINTSSEYINEAKAQFLQVFNNSVEEYGLWFSKDAEKILRACGAKRIAKDAKELLGYMIFNENRKASNRIKRISQIAVEISRIRNKSILYVKAEDIQKAEQILILYERGELNERNLCGILGILNAQSFLDKLKSYGIIS